MVWMWFGWSANVRLNPYPEPALRPYDSYATVTMHSRLDVFSNIGKELWSQPPSGNTMQAVQLKIYAESIVSMDLEIEIVLSKG